MWLSLDEPRICHINGLTQFIPGVLWRMCDELCGGKMAVVILDIMDHENVLAACPKLIQGAPRFLMSCPQQDSLEMKRHGSLAFTS